MDDHLVDVDDAGDHGRWELGVEREGRDWQLRLNGGDRQWTASGRDLFEALRNLRRQLDPLGIRLGCNGARANAWASGMQRDMGEGRVVYLCELGIYTRPAVVDTLGHTDPSLAATVDEQDRFQQSWLADRANAPGAKGPLDRERLVELVEREGIRRNSYSLDGGHPSETYVVDRRGRDWVVYYSERGLESGLRTFADEAQALRHLLKTLIEDPTTRA